MMMKFLVDLLTALVLRLVVLAVICGAAFGVGYTLGGVNIGIATTGGVALGILVREWYDGRKDWTR